MKKLGVIYAGAAYQNRTIHESKYKDFFDESIYLLDLPNTDLSQFKGVLVPSRIHQRKLLDAAPQFQSYLDAGGTMIALGEQPRPFLPGVKWEHRPTNFWWWLDPEAKSGLNLTNPDHSLFQYLGLTDATWHYHGVFWPSEGVDSIIKTDDGGSVIYVDKVTTAGTMVVTTLDPMFHYGSYFMPATEKFLDGFMPWVVEDLLA